MQSDIIETAFDNIIKSILASFLQTGLFEVSNH